MATGTSTIDFAKRLDTTAEDTEALLGRLLSDELLADEIARNVALSKKVLVFSNEMTLLQSRGFDPEKEGWAHNG